MPKEQNPPRLENPYLRKNKPPKAQPKPRTSKADNDKPAE